jgi:hypothetical protein
LPPVDFLLVVLEGAGQHFLVLETVLLHALRGHLR